ncbi:endonuclease III [Candidatus Magnetomonas plexicatena]|nr:endonuclease III [Nitrospirales bacterium LBB_01]
MLFKDSNSTVSEIVSKLKQNFPNAQCALNFTTEFELLAATILSAQCTDVRVNIVTKTLFKKYPTVMDFANADLSILEEDIKTTGFFKNKAEAIKKCAGLIIANHAGSVPKTMDELTKLPGVGRKTASVILAVAFSIPAIAVDTHVLRITNRLKLVNSKNPEKVEMTLRELIPETEWIAFSLSTVLFGRSICKAIKPLCSKCFLNSLCSSPDKNI